MLTALLLAACAGGGGSAAETSAPAETGGAAETGARPAPAVVVNEVVSDNAGTWTAPDGGTPDWIELAALEDAVLDGCALTDDWTEPALAPLDGRTMAAGDHLLLVADGSDAIGHVPFRVDADGDAVGLVCAGEAVDWVEVPPLAPDHAWARLPDGTGDFEDVARGTPGEPNARLEELDLALVEAGATWRYHDAGELPEGDWTAVDYDDSAWAEGPAPLGYGDDQATVISYGDDPSNKHPAAYFRRHFAVEGEVSSATLSIRVDDGAVVYVNGTEVGRVRMPDGEVAYDTWASETAYGDLEAAWTDLDVPPELLPEGAGVVAVEVHQAAPTSSDLTLDLSLSAVAWREVEAR